MKGNSLIKVILKPHIPLTDANNIVQRKIDLRDLFEKTIAARYNLEEVKRACRDKRLYVDLLFSLLQSTEEGRSKKDLDNMMKVVLDVLPERMVADGTPIPQMGLGLIANNRDDLIFEIHCEKKIVSDEAQEGIELEIAEHSD